MTLTINEIADVINISVSNPSESGYDVFVGLEHYDIGEPVITRFGSTKMLTTACKKFSAGDILLARRNVYLRRAGVVEFDGLTSGDSIVIRVKPNLSIEGVDSNAISRLLPFILNTNAFWDFANTNSDGTMSKRLSPQMLLSYEFELPPVADQKPLADKLWAAYKLKVSKFKLIEAIDEIVKSQFIEMFGEQSKCNRDSLQGNINEMFIGPFGSSLKNDCFVEREEGYCVVYEQKHAIDKDITVPFRYVTERKYKELKRFTILPNDIIVSCRGTVGQVFMIPPDAPIGVMHPSIMKIRLKTESYLPEFFVFALTNYMKERESQNVGTGIKMAVTATTLAKEKFPKPSLSEQKHFVDIVHQADKSKFELKKSIEKIDNVIKALMQ